MLLVIRYAEEALKYAWAAAKELPFRKPFLRLASCGPSGTARRKTLRRMRCISQHFALALYIAKYRELGLSSTCAP